MADVLGPAKWRQVEESVDRGLAWLASQQKADGSFPTLDSGQPAVTSLAVMAFLSRGHQPGVGPYGGKLNQAIDFVLSCQEPDGLFSYRVPGPQHVAQQPSHTATYNHAIAGLMLGEVYGQISGERAKAAKQAIERALELTRQLQLRPKDNVNQGGWRYIRVKPGEPDSDLSVTAWQLMFLRSAKNAEFDIPQQFVEEALAYVRRLWNPNDGMFFYSKSGSYGGNPSRGMTGAGILSLSMAGQHQTRMAQSAGDWLVAHPFQYCGELLGNYDKFYYATYYCSQAMAQLGGRHWNQFYPQLVEILLRGQSRQGSWPPEPAGENAAFGCNLTTAMAVLSLTPPYQLLPVYQR